ncbi:MAG TPA: P22 coat protein - protein 5 domain protein [Bacillota bacterium]|nr:P22 coat protein - protein 5 domain protein [Bacillota bacterium]
MAITNFIPTVWSARLLVNLNKYHVYAQPTIVNKDYEGEIVDMGDTVKINSIGSVTISPYTKNQEIPAAEALSANLTTLTIDQGHVFNFFVDDVEKAQAAGDPIDAAMGEAGSGLSDKADLYIASLYTEADPNNLISTMNEDTTPVNQLTKDNAYDYLVDLGTKLDEANVPSLNRFCIIPSWYFGLLQKDARFTKDSKVLYNGYIGEVAGMTVYKSNNVPNTNGADYKIMAGYPGAISFVEQIVKVEAYRPEKRFADGVKGLYVFGAKLIRPTGIAVLTANKPA